MYAVYYAVMPRIARSISDETVRARDALTKYLASAGLSVNSFARACGVKQCTLSRFFGGRTKTLTPAVRRALSYAGIDLETGITRITPSTENPRLRQALEKAWDGTPEMADLLADVIEALGPTLARSTRSRQERP